MPRIRCQTCSRDITDEPRVRLEWSGFTAPRMNGIAFWACPDHVRLVFPDRGIELSPRIEAEPDLVEVDARDEGWVADCRECGPVAIKPERDDAHLAAARHLARVHVGAVA